MKSSTRFLLPATSLISLLLYLPAYGAVIDCVTGNETISLFLISSSSPAVIAGGNCNLDIKAPIIANSSSGGTDAALLVQDDATVTLFSVAGAIISEGPANSLPEARAVVSLQGQSMFTMLGGSVSTEETSINADRAGVSLQDQSMFTMLGGSVSLTGASRDSDRAGVSLQGQSMFTMRGGSVTAAGSGINSDRTGIITQDNATAFLLGGMVSAAGSGTGVRNEIVAEDDSTIYVFGDGFNFPLGALQPLSGTLTGFLRDGSPIQWEFLRDQNANIILSVPEPSSVVLCGVGLLSTICIRRRRSV